MKNNSNFSRAFLFIFALLLFTSCQYYIRVNIDVPTGGELEDVILFVSDDGRNTKATYDLGDIDLTESEFTFNQVVDTGAIRYWWVIGVLNGDVVYSSVQALDGVDMYSVEPYDMPGAEITWDIPNNIKGYPTAGSYSPDWYAQTVRNHSSHAAPNRSTATLWRFNTGSYLGTFKIDLRNKD